MGMEEKILFKHFKYKKKLSFKYNQKLPLWEQVSKIICIGKTSCCVKNRKIIKKIRNRNATKIINFKTNIIDLPNIDRKKNIRKFPWNEEIKDNFFGYRTFGYEYAENNLFLADGRTMCFVVKNHWFM